MCSPQRAWSIRSAPGLTVSHLASSTECRRDGSSSALETCVASASGEHPVPKLSGGLGLRTARTFVHGGEPRLDLPAGHDDVRVDGRPVSSAGGSVDLSTLALGIGEHRIDCGPFSITFRLEAPTTDLPFEPEVGTDRAGAIQAIRPDLALTSGLAGLGPLAPVDRLHPCCPPDGAVYLLGEPGAVAAVSADHLLVGVPGGPRAERLRSRRLQQLLAGGTAEGPTVVGGRRPRPGAVDPQDAPLKRRPPGGR